MSAMDSPTHRCLSSASGLTRSPCDSPAAVSDGSASTFAICSGSVNFDLPKRDHTRKILFQWSGTSSATLGMTQSDTQDLIPIFPTFIIAEGISMYFPREVLAQLFHKLHALTSSPKSRFWIDHVTSSLFDLDLLRCEDVSRVDGQHWRAVHHGVRRPSDDRTRCMGLGRYDVRRRRHRGLRCYS